MSKSLKKKKYKNKIEQAIVLLGNGENLEYVKSELGIEDDEEFEILYSETLQELAEKLKNKPNELIYAEYFVDVMKVNKSIDEHITNLSGSKNTKEIAGILKIKLELAKELHINARERLFMINKPADVMKTNIGNINIGFFSNLSPDEKRKELYKFSQDYIKLTKKLDSEPKSILELDTSVLHYGPSVDEILLDESESSEIEDE
jgi:hypothetical protein